MSQYTNIYFPCIFRTLSGNLVQLFTSVTGTNFCEPSWVLAIPLFHFLRGSSKVCEPVKITNHRNSDWWGTTSLTKIIDRFTDSRHGHGSYG